MTKLTHISLLSLYALITVVVLASCRGREDELPSLPEQSAAIAFASVTEDQEEMTRAATDLKRDFVVYGYKQSNGEEQLVFDGYAVKYLAGSANTSEDNTHGYYYVGGDQTIKYWDFGASDYHFWGLWTAEPGLASFSGTHHETLTIPNVRLRVGDVPEAPTDNVLFSALNERRPVSADVVQLRFKRPYAKLRVQFYSTDTLLVERDNIEVSNISFYPDPTATSPLVNQIYGQGDVVITYPLTTDCPGNAHETARVENLYDPQPAFLFESVMLTSTLGYSSNTAVTAPIDASGGGFLLGDMSGTSLKAPPTRAGEEPGRNYYYYPLPMGELNPAFVMSICTNHDPQLKTAVVPANFMQWRPNFFYTYIFKITDAGKKIEFWDVQIEPWHYGGSQSDKWHNW